ncbi:hypothetical protein UXP62_23550, partial [Enterobacter roggenkampii]|uniref:hypothetical protein n=1 Tax=Enterobacter roggenkampii TaxID=1812935 RepID=UPI002FCF6F21
YVATAPSVKILPFPFPNDAYIPNTIIIMAAGSINIIVLGFILYIFSIFILINAPAKNSTI